MKTTENTTAHAPTPTPWRVAPASDYAGDLINIDAGTRGYIGTTGHRGDTEAEFNAELIVRAVNSHAELVAACQNAANVIAALTTGQLKGVSRDSAALVQLREALAKAKGQP